MQEPTQDEPSLVALFTFVARHPLTHKSTQLNPLQPQTPEEKQLFQDRQQVADARKAARNASAAEQQDGKQCLQNACQPFLLTVKTAGLSVMSYQSCRGKRVLKLVWHCSYFGATEMGRRAIG